MAEDFGTPITPEEPKKTNTVLIIGIVALVLFCCICGIILAGGFFYGDAVLDFLDLLNF